MTIEKVAHAFFWSFVAKVAAFALGFAASILIVRSLGAYDWGVLSELRTVLGFVLVLIVLGFDNALLKYLPVLRVSGGLRRFLRTFRGLVLIQCAVWICLVAVSRFGGPLLRTFFRGSPERFGFYLQLAVCFAIFEVFMLLVGNVLQSWYETKRLGVVIILGNVVYLSMLTVALTLGWGIPGVLVSSAAMNLVMVIMLVPHVRRLVRSVPDGAATDVPIGKILRFSLPFVANGLLNQVVWRQSEVILLGHFWGAKEAGYFSLAYRTPQLLLEFVPLAIWPIVMAGTSEVYARDAKSLPRAIDLYFRLLYLLVVPVAAMGFAFARPLVPMLYGSEMLRAALVTQLFFVVFSYSFLYTPMSMALYVMEKSWVNMLVFLSLAVLTVGLDLTLIPRYGLWGAFVPTSFVLVIAIIVFHGVVTKIRPDVKAPFGFIARCYVAAVPAALLGFVSHRWSSPLALLVEIPIAAVLLLLGFRFMKVVGPEEKEVIARLPIPWKRRILSIL